MIVAPRRRWPRAWPTRCARPGFLVFGPSAAAARLEASKGFTKEICDAAGAPTAAWARFARPARRGLHLASEGAPIVVKADGLAAGKGVIVAETVAEAVAALDDMFGGAFGAAGAEVVIEEFMEGEEASFFVPLSTARRCCPSAPRRTTSGSARATPGRTPAAWAPIPPRR